MESFGERLRRLRKAAGLSASALANAVGVTEGSIRQMESGQTKMASFVIGLRLAKALGVGPWYLANGVPDDADDDQSADALVLRVAALEQRMTTFERPRLTLAR